MMLQVRACRRGHSDLDGVIMRRLEGAAGGQLGSACSLGPGISCSGEVPLLQGEAGSELSPNHRTSKGLGSAMTLTQWSEDWEEPWAG